MENRRSLAAEVEGEVESLVGEWTKAMKAWKAIELAKTVKGEIRRSVPMAQHTSFAVGGEVDLFSLPEDLEDLRAIVRWCRESGVAYFVLGNGTNLLVRDGGIRAMAISLARGFCRIAELECRSEGSMVFAEAGQSLGTLVQFATEKGLSGLEWAAGIPGTVGGALFMNAGAFGGEMKDLVHSVRILDQEGNLAEWSGGSIRFGYRRIDLPEGGVILSGTFRLQAESSRGVKSRVQEILRRRMDKQPAHLPSAGSIFKNPQGLAAGRLIEESGLKGSRIGNAQVSEKHANFIVNLGGASARDISGLIAHVQGRVLQEKGIRLEMEIQVIGEEEGGTDGR
jgi:UDP-N-acetylmuramate dehydrogenase